MKDVYMPNNIEYFLKKTIVRRTITYLCAKDELNFIYELNIYWKIIFYY